MAHRVGPRKWSATAPVATPHGSVHANMIRLGLAAHVSKGRKQGAARRFAGVLNHPPPPLSAAGSAGLDDVSRIDPALVQHVTSVRPRSAAPARGGPVRTPSKSPPVRPPTAARPAPAYGSSGEAWAGGLRSAAMNARGLLLSPQSAPPAGYMAATLGPGRADPSSGGRRSSFTSLVLPDGRTAFPGLGSSVVGGGSSADPSASPYSTSAFAQRTGTASTGYPSPRPPATVRVSPGGGLRPQSAARDLSRAAGAPSGVLRVTGSKGCMYSTYAMSSSVAALPAGRPVRLATTGGDGVGGDGRSARGGGGVSPVFHDGTEPVAAPLPASPRPGVGTEWGRASGASRF